MLHTQSLGLDNLRNVNSPFSLVYTSGRVRSGSRTGRLVGCLIGRLKGTRDGSGRKKVYFWLSDKNTLYDFGWGGGGGGGSSLHIE